MTTRWPFAVTASVVLHALAVAGGLRLALPARAAEKPLLPAPARAAVEVFRIGVLPRGGGGNTAQPPAVAPAPLRVARSAPAPSAVHHDTSAPIASLDNTAGADAPLAVDDAPAGPASPGGEGLEAAAGPVGPGDGASSDVAARPAIADAVHAQLAAAARACYPAQARRFRQEGLVPVSFCVGAGGQPEQVTVTPSGLALLDEAVQSCVVTRAAPFPERAVGQCFSVQVEFGGVGGGALR